MPKAETVSNTTVAAPPTEASKSHTNWEALTKAGLRPVSIQCQAYSDQSGRLLSRVDVSCHSKLLPQTTSLVNHFKSGHGGEFKIAVRKSDKSASPIWAELAAQGIEAVDFRCEVCGAPLRFNSTSFLNHLRPHAGKTRQAFKEMAADNPGAIGMISLKLGKAVSESQLEDVDELSDEE